MTSKPNDTTPKVLLELLLELLGVEDLDGSWFIGANVDEKMSL